MIYDNSGRNDNIHGDEDLIDVSEEQIDAVICDESAAIDEILTDMTIDKDLAELLATAAVWSQNKKVSKMIDSVTLCRKIADWVISNEVVRDEVKGMM